jgi:hypothetical protein
MRQKVPRQRDNPFALLVLAFPFVMGGVILLLQRGPSLVIASPTYRAFSQSTVEASEAMAHGAGIFGVVVGCILAGIYFRIRYGS